MQNGSGQKSKRVLHRGARAAGSAQLGRAGAGRLCVSDSGAGLIEVFTNAQEDLPQGSIRHFAFATSDVDQCVKAVREAGYAITVEPKDVTLATTPPAPIRVAFCIGPVGEEIEFYQEK